MLQYWVYLAGTAIAVSAAGFNHRLNPESSKRMFERSGYESSQKTLINSNRNGQVPSVEDRRAL